ncbi:DM13 domain-containing protein [Arthrobacter sp. FW305-BF8]|uniref:DM13 domain-containing protein n=1 Tax=Arthrobacter sp. FW305-BF8 TaxID=2879617 RepID=UPI001F1FA09B|nr:DM13 domain-containing protein [Arthrobacter sp. FW305-BF8]UKA53855.1 DM13 domain-containing protein [Arthrobacter sp. FW305-BF8]
MEARTRQRRWLIAAAAGAVVLAVGLAFFKPWLLFVDVLVDEQLPTVVTSPAAPSATGEPSSGTPTAEPAGPVQLAEGTFISHEHATTGTVRIIQQPGGKRVLTLENLDTSNGPDVHVWLSAADVVEGTAGWFTAGSAEYFDLGMIKGNQGNQVYALPDELDLARFKSVDLWCVQFSVSFGAAQLTQ